MEKYPPPGINRLEGYQKESISRLLQLIDEKKHNHAELKRSKDEMIKLMASACRSDEDINRILDEVERWVRWRRVQGYWLSYLLQMATQSRNSSFHIAASILFSDSQLALGDDLGFHSLEVAAMSTRKLVKCAPDVEAFSKIEKAIKSRMDAYVNFYKRWCKPFKYKEANPLSEHLYSQKTWIDLRQAFPEISILSVDADPNELKKVVESCGDIELAYYRVIARRFLGLLYESKGQHEDALRQYEIGLRDALETNLESEIGHFHRLYGSALMRSERLSEAADQFDEAFRFEHKIYPDSLYWEALSARELGDTLFKLAADEQAIEKKTDLMKRAQNAYRCGLICFDNQQAVSPSPQIASVAKRQLFRSFSNNAFDLAIALSLQDVIAECEASGQTQATEMVSETQAAMSWPDDQRSIFRIGREAFHRHLNCIGQQLEGYWDALPGDYQAHRQYISLRLGMAGQMVNDLSSHQIAREFLGLKDVDCVLMLFYLGEKESYMILLDLKKKKPEVIQLAFTSEDVRIISQAYHDALKNGGASPGLKADMPAAINNLLKCYESMLEPSLSEIIPLIEGRRLVIVPRLQMNEVAIHALRVGEKRLLECCKVSYCPSLGVFLKLVSNFSDEAAKDGPIFAVYDKIDTDGFFEGAFSAFGDMNSDRLLLCRNKPWNEVISSSRASHARDMIFACHGSFDFMDPISSKLQLNVNEYVTFSEIFSKMDLGNCRSVILAACESGLIRSHLAEEYIGLPGAFLSAGVQTVVGSLWKVNELATSILLSKHFQLLNDGKHTVAEALCESELYLKEMTSDDVSEWIEKHLPEYVMDLMPQVKEMNKRPFEDPYYWAGFYSLGGPK